METSSQPTDQQAQGGGAPEPEGDAFDFKAFAEKVDAKFADIGKQLGKFYEFRRSLAGETRDEGAKPESSGKPGLSEADLDAAMTLGEKRAKLPEAARAKLDAMRKAGKSYSEVAEMADMLIDALGETKGNGGARPTESKTRDNPASGPRQTNGTSVRTYEEYQDLAYRARFKGDADAKRIVDALNKDPDFSIAELPPSRAPRWSSCTKPAPADRETQVFAQPVTLRLRPSRRQTPRCTRPTPYPSPGTPASG